MPSVAGKIACLLPLPAFAKPEDDSRGRPVSNVQSVCPVSASRATSDPSSRLVSSASSTLHVSPGVSAEKLA